MHIRKMTIDDYDKVYNLWMSCVGMGLNNLDDSREGIDKFIFDTQNQEAVFPYGKYSMAPILRAERIAS